MSPRPDSRFSNLRAALLMGIASAVLLSAGPADAQAERPLSIAAGSLDEALRQLARQTGEQLLYEPATVRGRQAVAISGRYTTEAALARLLDASGVEASRAGPNVLVLRPRPSPGPAPVAPAVAAEAARPFVDSPIVATAQGPVAAGTRMPPAREAETLVEAVEVTGSHIRGAAEGPSPVLILGREDLERSGHATVAAALAALPQNFAGTTNEGAVTSNTDRSGSNANYATGINLRGLGSDATLTLVNGRRMGGAGAKGDFADISTIPSAAVERVEILLDGASALYGSDAVGGVVNIILRRDVDGAETQAMAGIGAAGEPFEGRFAQLFGRRWSGGGAWISYELHQRDALPSAARRFAASADLRPLGGSDRRLEFAHPGNILRTDPATGASVPGWAIPAGQNGVGLRPSDFIAGAVNRSNQRENVDILPRQTRHSIYASAHQALSPWLELLAEARWGYRRYDVSTGAPFALLTVRAANPFFVSPNGATSNQIAYSFRDDLPPTNPHGSAESLGLSLAAEARLPRAWQGEGYLAFAQEIGEQRTFGTINSTFLNEALGSTADRADTPYSAVRDGFFNPYIGAGGNPANVMAFVASGFSNSRSRQRVMSANLKLDGPLFRLPGGDMKIAVGGQVRKESFRRATTNFSTGVRPNPASGTTAERVVLAAFAELRAPLFGPDNARPGLERLELSLAGRVEDYDDVGRTADPKVGVVWSPGEGLILRASYGQSFRAPGLRETRDSISYSPSLLPLAGATVLSLIQTGGNPDLSPETARSWSAGVDWRPPAVPGLRLSASWFDTRFDQRIDQPARVNILVALSDPALAPFVQRISPVANAADRAQIAALLASPFLQTAQGVFPPEAYGAIVDARYVNTATQHVRGIDLNGAYDFSLGDNALRLSGNATWLLDYRQQLTPTSPEVELVGIANYPVKLRARVLGDWSRGAYGATAAVNYIDGYRDPLGVGIRAQVTADVQLRWTGPENGPLEGLKVTAGVRNLFDAKPPFYDSPFAVGYDPANADPIGRFLSLQLTKRW